MSSTWISRSRLLSPAAYLDLSTTWRGLGGGGLPRLPGCVPPGLSEANVHANLAIRAPLQATGRAPP